MRIEHILSGRAVLVLETVPPAALVEINNKLELIHKTQIMNAQQLSEGLDKFTAQAGKIAQEQSDRFDVLVAEIAALKKAIDEGETPQTVVEAFGRAQIALDNMDAAIPDPPSQQEKKG